MRNTPATSGGMESRGDTDASQAGGGGSTYRGDRCQPRGVAGFVGLPRRHVGHEGDGLGGGVPARCGDEATNRRLVSHRAAEYWKWTLEATTASHEAAVGRRPGVRVFPPSVPARSARACRLMLSAADGPSPESGY